MKGEAVGGTRVAVGAVEAPGPRVAPVVQDGPAGALRGLCEKGQAPGPDQGRPGPCLGAGAAQRGRGPQAGKAERACAWPYLLWVLGDASAFAPRACLFDEEQPPTLGTPQKSRWHLCALCFPELTVLFSALFCGASTFEATEEPPKQRQWEMDNALTVAQRPDNGPAPVTVATAGCSHLDVGPCGQGAWPSTHLGRRSSG